jgi:mono/diheme cytochrome c family protein
MEVFMHKPSAYLISASIALTLVLVDRTIAADAAMKVDFSRDIRPLLSDRCFQCHGPDEKNRRAAFRLDQEKSALGTAESGEHPIVRGKPEASELIRRITAPAADERMPPLDSNKTLSKNEIELLRRWIKEGAEWKQHWAFVRPVRPAEPSVKDASSARNSIDRFVLARLEAEGLKPSPAASREALIRRVSFDLIGLPPTPKEIDDFLADRSEQAYERLVDRLLASPHYGEWMAVQWLDGARFADTNGYQNDFARDMSPWRDWVIQAYNNNMRYDEFVVEQIAGDLLPRAAQSQKVATGFLRNNRSVTEAGSIEAEWRTENLVDRVETTSDVMLGLTMGCARCHDHKYDPITQRDFYRFMAFLNSTKDKGFYNETRGNTGPVVQVIQPAQQRRIDELNAAIAKAQQAVAAAKAGTDAQIAEWKKNLAKLRAEKDDYQKKMAAATVMVLEEMEKPQPTYLLKRGQYDAPDKSQALEPGVPSFLPPLPKGAPPNRLGLARWLVEPANPLVARVEANRLWLQFFGLGLVATPDNLGFQGDPPANPQLLDWLATELMRLNWDIKALQREIVLSSTYRQASAISADLAKHDPENRLLARGPRHRLSAEAIRDNALAAAGLLSLKIGGRSVMPYQPPGLWEELAGGAGQGPYKQDTGEDLHRRSLYTYRKRTVPHPTTSTFDAPTWEFCTAKRSRTNTPLQALALLNDETYVEAARAIAQRMMLEGGSEVDQRLRYGFRLTTGRQPGAKEIKRLTSAYARYYEAFQHNSASAQALLTVGELRADAKLDKAKLAAYATIASILLNLDETITKQ